MAVRQEIASTPTTSTKDVVQRKFGNHEALEHYDIGCCRHADTREKMLCNFILTMEQMLETREEMLETREELPNTRKENLSNFNLTGASSDFGFRCKKHLWKDRLVGELLDIPAQKLIHCLILWWCRLLFQSRYV